MSRLLSDADSVLIYISDNERLLFRDEDRIADCWDGEPGAA